MPQQSAASVVDFLRIVERLKRTKRTGWVNSGIAGAESVADHMHRMGVMALLVEDDALDRMRCVKMSIVHDLAEALVGDITPFDGVSKEEKRARERQGMREIVDTLGGSAAAKEIEALWLEYEDNETAEARLVHDLDKCEMIQQALEYEESDGKRLDSFFNSTKDVFTHPQIRSWADEIRRRRRFRAGEETE
ncbi:hypothetical protein H4R18_003900 [Coemansia javaensis]|uniref:HD domain-containing protein n=1 Tax=Coemansia javaensis TaxID=2761396 RepID=A0A9W8HDV9_9FUNG|nr:hypothetical protein H4R18_003900 [Coemansia javaensis]